ncbi:microsomal glutathione S transferase [Trichoderma parareesei]|uniref:Microsomal glutathione S transferase n=1 Tax=Trichoderma parareesei TaxID=858221 RepID=A0A2H2ZUR9_TRIPA|nr:microsomal glutathione S transferase [Trichoderma parareesei]
MAITLAVPDTYGLVLAAATSTFFVNTFHMFRTSKLRKASNIPYPNAYATHEQAKKDVNAYRFNCAQRAHANFIENQPSALGALLISGLHFPVAAAVLGATWSVGRTLYLYGYTSSAGPKGRTFGAYIAGVADLSLKLMAAYTSYLLVAGK